MMNEEYELLFLLVESEKWKIALMQLGNRKPKNVYSLPLQGDKRGSILFYLPSQFLHKRKNNLAQHFIIEAVLAFKTDYVRVVFVE